VLFVRARQASLDAVDSILQVLTATTPQVLVQVKFIEVSQDDEKALGFDWYLGQVTGTPTNAQVPGVTSGIRGTAPGAFPGSGQSGGPGPTELRGDELDWAGRSATNAKSIRVNAMLGSQMTGILTEAQSRVVLKALEQRSGTDVLSAPSVTTLSGRQAQIQVVDMKTVATGTDPLAGTNAVTTAVIPCGPVLDVVPTVLADGVTVQVNVKASVTEFLGYDPAARGSASGTATPFSAAGVENDRQCLGRPNAHPGRRDGGTARLQHQRRDGRQSRAQATLRVRDADDR
jgi:general secretion pathway protein D